MPVRRNIYGAVKTANIADNAVTVAKLESYLQQVLINMTLTGTNDADGTATMSIQVKDSAGDPVPATCRVRTWHSTTLNGAPVAATDFSVITGTQLREITADADYEVISGLTGLVVMNIVGANGEHFVMAEVDGRVTSQVVAITGN